MVAWFVSRHPGAHNWALKEGIVARVVAHLDIDQVESGDDVIGTLPVSLAAQVCEKGARYMHLTLDLPQEARGRDLSVDEMNQYGARIERFDVRRVS